MGSEILLHREDGVLCKRQERAIGSPAPTCSINLQENFPKRLLRYSKATYVPTQ